MRGRDILAAVLRFALALWQGGGHNCRARRISSFPRHCGVMQAAWQAAVLIAQKRRGDGDRSASWA